MCFHLDGASEACFNNLSTAPEKIAWENVKLVSFQGCFHI